MTNAPLLNLPRRSAGFQPAVSRRSNPQGMGGSSRPGSRPANSKRNSRTPQAPVLVAIVGGSGAGKSRLAERLETALGGQATRLALDDFYRDRSYLSLAQRARINYDHPRAIDWARFERVLRCLRSGRAPCVPAYDFATHARLPKARRLAPKPIVLVEGLWLLRRPSLRRAFTLRVFLECATRTRLQRRLARDKKARGRTTASVRAQFRDMVEPMHRKFVAPQARWADVVLSKKCDARQVEQLAAALQSAIADKLPKSEGN